MQIINLTPHPIKLGRQTIRQAFDIEPVRVDIAEHTLYTVNDVPVKMLQAMPSRDGLPDVLPNTIYIVSRMVADVYRDLREDFVFPYNLTRTPTGKIVGCKSLARFEPNE